MPIPLRVLIVEDSQDDTALLLQALRAGDFDVSFFRVDTPAGMRAALAEQVWDLVISDYQLPYFNAPAALALLQASGLDLPFIITSGHVGEASAVDALKAGAHDFVQKGSPARLIPAISRALRDADGRRQRQRMETAEREQRTLAEALRDTAAVLNSTLEFDALLDSLLEIVGRVVKHDSANIMLLEDGRPRVVRHKGRSEQATDAGSPTARLSLQNYPTLRYMFETGQPIVVANTRADQRWTTLDATDWIASYVGMPIRVKAQVIGFLNLNSAEPGFFGQVNTERLRAFADQAATALENAQLYENLRRVASRAEAMARVASRLNVQLDLDNVLNTICAEIAWALGSSAVTVTLYDEVAGHLRLAAATGLPPGYLAAHRPIPVSPSDFAADGFPIVVPDTQQWLDRAQAEWYAADNVRALAAAPMWREAQLIGTINVLVVGAPRTFTHDDLLLLQGLAHQAAQATANARLFAETQRRLRNLNALRTIDLAISGSLDLRTTLNVLLEQVTSQLNVDAAAVLLLNRQTMLLQYAAGRGFRHRGIERSSVRVGQGDAGRAALERLIVSRRDLRHGASPLARAELLAGEDFDTYYGVPLLAKGQVCGVLDIFHRAPLNPDPEWLDFLETLSRQAAIAIENATLFDSLQRSHGDLALAYDSTLEGWSRALDLRDKETEGHSQRVAEMTQALAMAHNMRFDNLVHVRRGALLHDIGKMGIPDRILLKPGPLTDEEWVIMRQHPTFAYELLAPIGYLRLALDIPYCHHEKWDGAGYPRGLTGEQIPLAARLFAVVDVWDALSSERPYRPAWSADRVEGYLREQAGTHFDPRVVEAFLKILDAREKD